MSQAAEGKQDQPSMLERAEEIQQQIQHISGRDWQLWSIGILIRELTILYDAFRSGRLFAAWLGLTPKDHSTAGKTRLGKITRAGDERLRVGLCCGECVVEGFKFGVHRGLRP